MKKIISALCTMLCMIYGCGLTGGETIPPAAGVYIINASPDAPAIDVALNNNTIANGYAYEKDSGYFLNSPGTYAFKISQTTSGTVLLDQLINFPAGAYHSLFLIDSFNMLKVLFIEDKLTTDTSSYAKIRFFNFCPNSPAVKAIFASAEKDTLTFSSRVFNDQGTSGGYTKFTAVPGGTYNLSLYQADTSLLIKDWGNLVFSNGKYYTVYMKGLYENSSVPLDIATIQH